MKRLTEEENFEQENVLAGQIAEFEPEEEVSTVEQETVGRETMVGKKLGHNIGAAMNTHDDVESVHEEIAKRKLTRVGEKIQNTAELRDGWLEVDRALLGERDIFYPESWVFKIRPATVEAVKNWSLVDEESINSIDDAFNEILKYCLTIKTPTGLLNYGSLNVWDRFFFVLLIREYTFEKGEKKIQFYEECPNCDEQVEFNLTSQSLMFDMPDPSVMKYYDSESQVWQIDPNEFGVPSNEYIILHLPTVEKDANTKAWMIDKLNENPKAKIDSVFIKFLMWIAPKISKDMNICKRQISNYQMTFKQWDVDLFNFMDDVVKNVVVTPSTDLIAVCPKCQEEMTARIRFQNGVRDLFAMDNRHKKFGTK